jgi:hypothetical protein
MLKRLGFRFAVVPAQDKFDGAFPDGEVAQS